MRQSKKNIYSRGEGRGARFPFPGDVSVQSNILFTSPEEQFCVFFVLFVYLLITSNLTKTFPTILRTVM